MRLLGRYTHWLHGQWPAGEVERLPVVGEDGDTSVPGVYIAGDLTGVPLLKFAVDRGARVVQTILADPSFSRGDGALDLVIIGGGVAGMAAALEARKHGLSFELLEASEPFSTIVNFPKGKPIFTYPTGMQTAGDLRISAKVKEALVDELTAQTLAQGIVPRIARAHRLVRSGKRLTVELEDAAPLATQRVLVAIGSTGNYRSLGVPGEELHEKVLNRLHDPKDHAGQRVLVVGGGDSAVETAVALDAAGAQVTLSYRQATFSRPKPENLARLTPTIQTLMSSQVQLIETERVTLGAADGSQTLLPNDVVLTMIGREPPLDFFRRSGIAIHGEWTWRTRTGFALFLGFCFLLYHWSKGGLFLNELFQRRGWFPFFLDNSDPGSLTGATLRAMRDQGFHYSSLYCAAIVFFGIRRIRRRRTPYVTRQTLALMAIQVVPLFLLPYILLPWLGANGFFDAGAGKLIGDHLFPGGSYWRAFGLILAWPLFLWNVFTSQPIWAWLIISLVQTFLVIPLLVRYRGKGAYCGWICSCGALAETMGDAHREKMPHGPFWNRLNMLGQAILAAAFGLLALRIIAWIGPGGLTERALDYLLSNGLFSYKYLVDLWLAGIIGVGFYFHFSGRVWCRFACPLAALMHIYARFSRFRILADKNKCISCNVCTRVCHQGIDVMSFANKGEPMADPQCVRCSACVQSCPTGVLAFGQIDPSTHHEISRDRLTASPVHRHEQTS